MNNPLNSTIHPELGPRNPGVIDGGVSVTNGSIVFNKPLSSSEDPRKILQRAVDGGDSIPRRISQLSAALTVTSEQK